MELNFELWCKLESTLTGHLQVASGGYASSKQSSFRDLTALCGLEIL